MRRAGSSAVFELIRASVMLSKRITFDIKRSAFIGDDDEILALAPVASCANRPGREMSRIAHGHRRRARQPIIAIKQRVTRLAETRGIKLNRHRLRRKSERSIEASTDAVGGASLCRKNGTSRKSAGNMRVINREQAQRPRHVARAAEPRTPSRRAKCDPLISA